MLDLNQSISRLILLDTVHITHIKLMVLFNFFFLYTDSYIFNLWHRLCFPAKQASLNQRWNDRPQKRKRKSKSKFIFMSKHQNLWL